MTPECNGDAIETPDLPGFRVFGAGNRTEFGRFGGVFNALKMGATFTRREIFNALKIYGAGCKESDKRRYCNAAT